MRMAAWCAWLALLLSVLAATPGHGQQSSSEQPADAVEAVLDEITDEFDRVTPRRSLRGFLTAAQARDFESAAEYLDLRNLPSRMNPVNGPSLAQGLAIVIERELWIDLDEISDLPEGVSGDALPSYRDRFAEIELDGELITLLLQRVPRGDTEFRLAADRALASLFGDARIRRVYHNWFGRYGEPLSPIVEAMYQFQAVGE